MNKRDHAQHANVREVNFRIKTLKKLIKGLNKHGNIFFGK